MGLFSKKKDEPRRNEFQWATNAPTHWPPIFLEKLDSNPAANIILFVGKASIAFERSPDCHVKLSAFMRRYLDQRGIVEAPIEFEESGVKYPIFLFPEANSDAAARFAGIWDYFNSRGIAPVYYAPQPLPQAIYSASPFQGLGPAHFSKWKGDLPNGDFPLWWATENQNKFSGSECALDIDRTMRALNGYCTYFAGMIAYHLGMLPKDTIRTHLPSDLVMLNLEGPEGQLIVMSMSREKGIGFHFNDQTTPPEYRDAFWHVLARSAEELSVHIRKKGLPIDPPEDREWMDHWNAMTKVIRQKEEIEGTSVGKVSLVFTSKKN